MKWYSLLNRLSEISQKGFTAFALVFMNQKKTLKCVWMNLLSKFFLPRLGSKPGWDLLYNNKLRFGYQYLLLDQHSILSLD
jgi:hypothetical protein